MSVQWLNQDCNQIVNVPDSDTLTVVELDNKHHRRTIRGRVSTVRDTCKVPRVIA